MRVRLELPARVQRLCVVERRQRLVCPACHHWAAQEIWSNSLATSTSFINAINAGILLTLGTSGDGINALGIVGDHDYAVLGYNSSNQTFTLLNPWGWNNTNAPGILNLTWTQVTQNFFLDGNCN